MKALCQPDRNGLLLFRLRLVLIQVNCASNAGDVSGCSEVWRGCVCQGLLVPVRACSTRTCSSVQYRTARFGQTQAEPPLTEDTKTDINMMWNRRSSRLDSASNRWHVTGSISDSRLDYCSLDSKRASPRSKFRSTVDMNAVRPSGRAAVALQRH
jgi:hypothetical protein